VESIFTNIHIRIAANREIFKEMSVNHLFFDASSATAQTCCKKRSNRTFVFIHYKNIIHLSKLKCTGLMKIPNKVSHKSSAHHKSTVRTNAFSARALVSKQPSCAGFTDLSAHWTTCQSNLPAVNQTHQMPIR